VGVAGYAEVIINHGQNRYFSSMWGSGQITVSARAVARGLWISGNPNPNNNLGVLVLGRPSSNSPVVSENGNTGIDLPNTATFAVNDPNQPFAANGKPEITAGAFVFGATSSNLGNPPTFNGPSPTYNTQTADPLSGLAAPSKTGLVAQSYTGQSVLDPGVYTGVINLGGNSNVIMNPGIYYLQPDGSGNAGITMSGNATLDGTSGVLMYVAPPVTAGTGTLTLSNGGTNALSLNPIAVGTYEGISIFVDQAWGNGNANGNSNVNMELGGTPNANVYGTIYAPTANLKLHGTPNANTGSQIIVYSISLKGNSNVSTGQGPRAGQDSTFQLVE
jgi:hypothetical protein